MNMRTVLGSNTRGYEVTDEREEHSNGGPSVTHSALYDDKSAL